MVSLQGLHLSDYRSPTTPVDVGPRPIGLTQPRGLSREFSLGAFNSLKSSSRNQGCFMRSLVRNDEVVYRSPDAGEDNLEEEYSLRVTFRGWDEIAGVLKLSEQVEETFETQTAATDPSSFGATPNAPLNS